MKRWTEKQLFFQGDPNKYAQLVFRRYGRDGSYPEKRGYAITIFLSIIVVIEKLYEAIS
jgi:hypothetical protein